MHEPNLSVVGRRGGIRARKTWITWKEAVGTEGDG